MYIRRTVGGLDRCLSGHCPAPFAFVDHSYAGPVVDVLGARRRIELAAIGAVTGFIPAIYEAYSMASANGTR